MKELVWLITSIIYNTIFPQTNKKNSLLKKQKKPKRLFKSDPHEWDSTTDF